MAQRYSPSGGDKITASDILHTNIQLRQMLEKPEDSDLLLSIDDNMKTATRVRLFAESHGMVFFGSVNRPSPYDFKVEKYYCQSNLIYSIDYGLVGTHRDAWIEIGKFSFREHATNSETPIIGGAGYIRAYLPYDLPQIIIVSQTANRSGMKPSFSGLLMEKHDLEGDFPDHFLVYADKRSRTLVREILTPDVMQILKYNFSDYDIEISRNGLFAINSQSSFDTTKSIQQAVERAKQLYDEIFYQISDNLKARKLLSPPLSSDHYVATKEKSTLSLKGFAREILLAAAILAAILIVIVPFILLFSK